MATNPWLVRGALIAGLAIARPAHAADWLTLLDWACDANPTNTAAVKAMVLSACKATEGHKTACDVVAGTPFACFTSKAVARDNKSCDKARLSFKISAATKQTLGWQIAGTLDVEADYALFWKTAQECELTAKTPVPTAQGGDYIFKAGEAKAVVIMIASGEGKITFLGGTVFSEDATKKCAKDMSVTAYMKATASACTAKPPPSPTPTGTPGPSPTASATPTPAPTASATPLPPTPTPAPTASATPLPATPTPAPTASATPLPATPTPAPTASATPLPATPIPSATR